MYAKFNLDISEIHRLKTFSESRPIYGIESINIDEVRKAIRPNLKALVKGSTSAENVIDGNALKNYIFPTGEDGNYDVFISYSHDDTDDAIFLYGLSKSVAYEFFLTTTCGVVQIVY